MEILIASQSDILGGAARAGYRLHRAFVTQGVNSRMTVRVKKSDDPTVIGPKSRLAKLSNLLRPSVGDALMNMQKPGNTIVHSGNWLPSMIARAINSSTADVVNLHWVAGETASIEDIGRIRKPLVWTLHDMWPFCGAEHYAEDDAEARWRQGYNRSNRGAGARGLDLDRRVWLRKRRALTRPMYLVAPSRWLGRCANESALLRNCPVSVIPNVLDTAVYQPLNRDFCRQALGLPKSKRIILFGAAGGARDPRKGYDLLVDALGRLTALMDVEDLVCVVFGQSAPKEPRELAIPVRWLGHLHDDTTLALLYNSADVMVVPSRQEALGQTATEPQACGCPVVAFNCTGLSDALAHRETGYLASPFDVQDMAEGIRWVLQDTDRRVKMGQAARRRALRLWAPAVIVPQYLQVYEAAMQMHSESR